MSTPVVVVSGAGTPGPRGSGWLSGSGAPSNTIGLDGDFYLDTTNVGVYYGPKTAGAWGSSHAFTGPLTNFSAVTAPTINSDGTQGYSRGSTWINTTTGIVYVCTNNTTGAAVWLPTFPVGTTANTVAAGNDSRITGAIQTGTTVTGDVTGTIPSGTVVSKVNGVSVSGTPVAGYTTIANTPTAATWQLPSGFLMGTGIQYGGNMTVNGSNPAAFDLAAAVGFIVDYVTVPTNPTATKVTLPAQTITLTGAALTRVVNWWVSDSNGNITSQANEPTNVQRRTSLVIGVTASTIGTGAIFTIQAASVLLNQGVNQFYDLAYGLGPFSISGNVVNPNGATLTLAKTAGTMFDTAFATGTQPNDPHTVTSPAETPITFRYATQLTNSESALTTTWDPGHYDVGGVITLVPGGTNTATIQRLYLFGTGVAGAQTAVQYGQTMYASLSAASAAIGTTSFIQNPDFNSGGVLIAWVCMIKSATDLSNASQCTIVPAHKFVNPQ